jgi:hypothetical protein
MPLYKLVIITAAIAPKFPGWGGRGLTLQTQTIDLNAAVIPVEIAKGNIAVLSWVRYSNSN